MRQLNYTHKLFCIYSQKLPKFIYFLMVLFAINASDNLQAQNVSTYTFAQSTGTYTAIAGTTIIAAATDDGASALTNIGFNFTYCGVVYTQFGASSNGFITLGAVPGTTTYTPLSSIVNSISFAARDAKTGGAVTYLLSGTSPNRVLTIQYPNWQLTYSNASDIVSAQIKLYETTNVIEIIYNAATKVTAYTPQVGLSGAALTDFSTRTGTNWAASTAGGTNAATMTWSSTSGPANGQLYRWTPPVPTITSFTPSTICANGTITINGTNLLGATAATVKVGGTAVASITSNSGTQIVAVIGTGTTGSVTVQTASATVATSGTSATVSAAPTAPPASAGTSITTTGFTANWAASSGATSYLLDVSTVNTFASFVTGYNNVNVGNVLTTSVSGLTSGTTYYYRVRATNASACTSTSSGTITVTTTSLPTINVPATGSNSVVCGTTTNIYDNGGSGADYANSSNGYTVLNNSGTGVITLTGTYSGIETCCDYLKIYAGVGTGGTLLYTYNGTGSITTYSSPAGQAITILFTSDGSVTASATTGGFALTATYSGTCALPPTVTSFSPTSACGGTSITITGTNLTGASGVTVGGTAATITSNTATQIIATIGAGTTGTVAVTTGSGTGTSAGTFTVNTTPTAPTPSSATSITASSFVANWAASAGASSYQLDIATDAGFTTFVTGYNNLNVGNVLTKSITGLAASTNYYYRVRAVGASCTSLNSSTTTATTLCIPPNGATFAAPIAVGTLGCTAYTSTLSNVTTNCYGNDYSGTTNQASDDIFYQFVLSNANGFSTIVNMGHCGTAFDTYIHLTNSAGTELTYNDDNGVLCTGSASSIQQTLTTGTYYVVSEGYSTGSGSIITTISIPAVTGTGTITGTATICAPTTGITYSISGYTNATGYVWTVPTGATITAGQGTATITVSFVSGASSGNVTCTPYNGPCAGTAASYALTLNSVTGTPATFPTGQWNVYTYNSGDATGGSGAWTTNYVGYYPISSLNFNTQTIAPTWANTLSPSSAAGYLGCPVNIDNHSYVFKRQGVPTCGTYRIDVSGHDDAAILKINGVEVWRHVTGCCDVHTGIWSGYLDASSQIEYYISEGSGGSNADMTFTQITTTATVTGVNPTTCGGNGTLSVSNQVGGYANIVSSGFGAVPSGTTVYGSASITGEECVLTSASASLLGNWGIVPSIRPDFWEITYQQYIGGGSGADGMSFSYGNFSPTASNGGEAGFGTGLSISFDTYTSATNSQLWIYYDGAAVASSAVNVVNLRTATYVPVTITVNSSNQVTVIWNGTTIFSNVALPAGYASANKSTWNYAFSARTGGSTDIHKVDNVNLYAINYFDYSINNGTTWQTSNVFSVPQGTYTVIARHKIGTSCATSTLGSSTLSNPALPTITLGTVASVCSGATTISLPYTATTNSPNQFSVTTGTPAMASFAAVSNAAITTSPLNITIPASATANTYQFNITVTNSTTACTSTTQTFAVTVANVPTLTAVSPSSANLCPGGLSATFSTTGSGGTGSGGAYQWQYSTGGAYTNLVNGGSSAPYFNTSGNTNASTVVITPFSGAGTGFAIRCVYTTTGTGCTATSSSVSIGYNTASVAPTSATASSISICSGTNISLTSSGGSAGTGATLKWYSASCGGTLVGTGSPLTVAPTSNTTYYSRYEGTCNTTLCANVAIAVTPAPSLSTSFVSPLCNGNTNGSINLTVSGLTPTITFDGTINEAVWGSALATSSGGPSAGFGAGHEVNALYATADETYSYFAIAGNVQSGNRILLFLDTKTGGYNTANFDRTNAPAGINNFHSATTFDTGFEPDYCLVIGTNGSGTYYYDLFSLAATGANNFLGTNGSAGLGASPANSSNMQGFEIRIPNTALGYVGGGVKAFAAYISDGGFLSNQFLTKAGSSDGNYGSGAVTFGAAAPNPLTTSNITYAWSNSATTQDLSNIAAGTYSVTVSSASSCTATTSVTVTQPAVLVGNTCVTTSDFCQAGTGAIKVVATGGTPPYNIVWTPSVGSASPSSSIATNGGFTNIINIIGGTSLSVSITDANGCQTP